MLLILYVVLATCSSCLTDVIFPEALVFEGLGLSDMVNNSKPNENRNDSVIIAGDLNDALTTMDFHRKNINDYLCRQYIVEGILQDITDSASSEGRSISQDNRRMTKTSAILTDQGSSAYNAWLIKTKLLKKIYDEYDLSVKMHEKPVGFTLKTKNNESSETHDHETMKNADDMKDLKKPHHSNEGSSSSPSAETVSVDFAQSHSEQYDIDDEKEYKKPNQPSYHDPPDFNPKQSIQQPPAPASEPSFSQPSDDDEPPPLSNETPSLSPSDFGIQSSSSYELPPYTHELPPPSYNRPPPSSSYDSHSYPPKSSSGYPFLRPLHYRYPRPGLIPPTTNPGPNRFIETWHQPDVGVQHHSNTEPLQRPALTATDMYDLTLTAIAFLGFGTFVMNLVMDAMASQSGATITINSSPSHGGHNHHHRARRHGDNSGFGEINELSWTVVSTIDNMMANVDGTPVNCAEVKQLCRRSKRLVKTGANFSSKLLPVWNVALGWLSKKLGTDSSQPVISAILGHCTLPSQCQSNS